MHGSVVVVASLVVVLDDEWSLVAVACWWVAGRLPEDEWLVA